MRFYFHELAQTEFDRAVEYYEDCRSGLGMEFAREVHATIARIIKYPNACSPSRHGGCSGPGSNPCSMTRSSLSD